MKTNSHSEKWHRKKNNSHLLMIFLKSDKVLVFLFASKDIMLYIIMLH